MVRFRAALLVVAVAGAALAPLRAGEVKEGAERPTDCDICGEDLETRIRHLASDALGGRDTTEASGHEAARWIAAEFARAGLEPLARDGEGKPSWFQEYVAPKPMLGEGNALELTTPDGKVSFQVEKDWNPFSVSPPAEAEGPLVFAGFGITAPDRDHDDYAGLDAKGKVVLVFRRNPGWDEQNHATFVRKLANAADHGAAAILLCNDVRTTKSAGRDEIAHWSAPIGAAAGSAKIPYAFVTQQVAKRLLASLGSLEDLDEAIRKDGPRSAPVPGVSVRLKTVVLRSEATNAKNVVGFLRGRDETLAAQHLVVGAHYDHIGEGRFGSLGGATAAGTVHNGADDNASGTAALLELAEWFAAPENRPRRSLVFVAFSGEEMGLLGSAHYAGNPSLPLADAVAMVNMDMVGRCREGRLEIGGVGTGEGLQDLVAEANGAHGFSISWDLQGEAPTDSTSFFRKKVPVLWFFTGLHPDYHRPTDDWDKIDCTATRKVCHLVRDTVRTLADREARLAYTDPPAPPRPPYLGIRPSREPDSRGIAVEQAVPGGPAEAAGIRAGDVIVTVGDQPIREARDLFGVLGRLEPGKSVKVGVLRGDETLTLDVTLGERPGGGRRP